MPQTTFSSSKCRSGDGLASLIASVYPELVLRGRAVASSEPKQLQIDPDDLVQESLLRVLSTSPLFVSDRDHFVRIVSITMRRVIIDHARSSSSRKQRERLFAQGTLPGSACKVVDQEARIDLRSKLRQLARDDPRLAESLHQHYYGTLSTARVAERVDRSRRSVQCDLRSARSRLRTMLSRSDESVDGIASRAGASSLTA